MPLLDAAYRQDAVLPEGTIREIAARGLIVSGLGTGAVDDIEAVRPSGRAFGARRPAGTRDQIIVNRRGEATGVPHVFRHTMAHRFRLHGGQEGDLASLGGWTDRNMLARYGASAATEQAVSTPSFRSRRSTPSRTPADAARSGP